MLWILTPEERFISKKVVNMVMEYVSIEEFKKLEKKVNHILAVHALDEKLSKEEKKLVDEVKKDIKEDKSAFVSVDDL